MATHKHATQIKDNSDLVWFRPRSSERSCTTTDKKAQRLITLCLYEQMVQQTFKCNFNHIATSQQEPLLCLVQCRAPYAGIVSTLKFVLRAKCVAFINTCTYAYKVYVFCILIYTYIYIGCWHCSLQHSQRDQETIFCLHFSSSITLITKSCKFPSLVGCTICYKSHNKS